MTTMIEAIAAHRAAWQAFQDAPNEKQGGRTVISDACDEEGYALTALLTLIPQDISEVRALKEYLGWFVEEEGQRFDAAPEVDTICNWPFAVHAALTIALAIPLPRESSTGVQQ